MPRKNTNRKPLKKNLTGDAFEGTDEDYVYLATCINPKDGRLYDIIRSKTGTSVSVTTSSEDHSAWAYRFGKGHYDKYDEFEWDGEDFYRSHTPDGVAERGGGLGFLLYSGLALAAFEKETSGYGVYSETEQRSSLATRWWENQVRHEYAEEASKDSYESDEHEINTADVLDIDTDYCHSIDPERVYVTVECSTSKEVQVLKATTVAEKGFILAWSDSLEEKMDFEEVPREVLWDIDPSTVTDPKIIANLLEELAKDNDHPRLRRFAGKLPQVLKGITHPVLLEMLGQQTFPFARVQEDVEEQLQSEMKANRGKSKKYSKEWLEYFGDMSQYD